jgi:hypothetical protein
VPEYRKHTHVRAPAMAGLANSVYLGTGAAPIPKGKDRRRAASLWPSKCRSNPF